MERQTAWWKNLTWLAVPMVFLGAGTASAQEVRIVAADGTLDPSGRVTTVKVRPGQVVSLSADEVWTNDRGELEYAYRPVEDFVWSTGEMGGDACDPSQGCAADSLFEITEYGVNFYVPWDAPERIRVNAKLRWGAASDFVVLVNREAAAHRPHWDRHLDGLGHWVLLNGASVFVPYHYTSGWAPYRHGHWYWSSYGWTWNSYDPWGYVTDHCGHWRHSILYGWVWIPQIVCTWRPAVVSFFYGPSWIGWYPYDPGWHHGYRRGYADGYNDGYWTGHWVGHRAGHSGHLKTHPGLHMVSYKNFYVPGKPGKGPAERAYRFPPNHKADMSSVMASDPVKTNRAFMEAVKKGHVGPVPGGGKDPSKGRKFIAGRTGVQPEEVKMRPAWNDGDGKGRESWLEPESGKRAAPARYKNLERKTRDSTIGSKRTGSKARGRIGGTSTSGGSGRSGPAAQPRIGRSDGKQRAAWIPKARTRDEDPAVSRRKAARKADIRLPVGRSEPRSTPSDRSVRRPADGSKRKSVKSSGSKREPSARPTRVPDKVRLPPQEKPEHLRPQPRARPEGKRSSRDAVRTNSQIRRVPRAVKGSGKVRKVEKSSRKSVRSSPPGKSRKSTSRPSYRSPSRSKESNDSGNSYRPKKTKSRPKSVRPSRDRPAGGSFNRGSSSGPGRSRGRGR